MNLPSRGMGVAAIEGHFTPPFSRDSSLQPKVEMALREIYRIGQLALYPDYAGIAPSCGQRTWYRSREQQ